MQFCITCFDDEHVRLYVYKNKYIYQIPAA